MTLQESKTLVNGQKLKYTGKGFIGFRINDREVTYNEEKEGCGIYDIWVKYDGYNILVRVDEVEKSR